MLFESCALTDKDRTRAANTPRLITMLRFVGTYTVQFDQTRSFFTIEVIQVLRANKAPFGERTSHFLLS